jgi:four helix bundle protein
MPIERFEDIEGWQLARELTRMVYAATRNQNFSRDIGLKDQIQRASGSVMHNIAEGFDSGSNAEFVRFLRYAQRSCTEVKSQLYAALDQSYLSQDEFTALYEQASKTHKKIGGFIRYLTTNKEPGTKNE